MGASGAADVVCRFWGQSSSDACGAEAVDRVCAFCDIIKEKEDVTGVVQTVDETIGGCPGVGASSDVFDGLRRRHGHPLVEHETFTLPVFCPDFTVVIHDAAVQLVNPFKAVGSEECRSFFATDSAGAVHQHLTVTKFSEAVHISREFPKVFDIAFNCIGELTDCGLIAVSDIHEDDIRIIFDRGLPFGWGEMVVMGIGLERDFGFERDDFRSDFDGEFWERLVGTETFLDFHVGKAGIGVQERDELSDVAFLAAEGSVEAFFGDNDSALDAELLAAFTQLVS